jgi:putative transposase
LETITTAPFSLVALLLYAIGRVNVQQIFDRDPYESRRTAMQGSRLLKVLVFYQLLAAPSARGLVEAIEDSLEAQAALGGMVARNTLSNALSQRDLEHMIEAWMLLLGHYGPCLEKLGRKFARIAAVDASLIKLSLAAFTWASYREQTGAAKMTCVLDWMRGVPHQFVFTAAGRVHDLKAAAALKFSAGWTYLFDRGYFSFDFLTALIEVGAHFVIRLKEGVDYCVVCRHAIPDPKMPAGVKEILRDWTVKLPGWDQDLLLRLVVYRLTDKRVISVLTSRHDLSAHSIVLLYKERWSIEKWWRWVKRLYKVKEPLGRNENALPLQIVAAFVTDLLLRVFKHGGGFKGTLYEFVRRCREQSLTPFNRLGKELGDALSAASKSLELTQASPQEQS